MSAAPRLTPEEIEAIAAVLARHLRDAKPPKRGQHKRRVARPEVAERIAKVNRRYRDG